MNFWDLHGYSYIGNQTVGWPGWLSGPQPNDQKPPTEISDFSAVIHYRNGGRFQHFYQNIKQTRRCRQQECTPTYSTNVYLFVIGLALRLNCGLPIQMLFTLIVLYLVCPQWHADHITSEDHMYKVAGVHKNGKPILVSRMFSTDFWSSL